MEKKIFIPWAKEFIPEQYLSYLSYDIDTDSYFVIDTIENRKKFKDILPIGFKNIPNLNLNIDLIPKTSWGASLSNSLTKESWDSIRKPIVLAHNNRCQICGLKGKTLSNSIRDVDTHELWSYSKISDPIKIQKLVGFMCLCSSCHLMFHLGFADVIKKQEVTIKRLKMLEKKDDKEIQLKISKIFNVWNERSKHEWMLDLTILKTKPFKDAIIDIKKTDKLNPKNIIF